MKRIFITGGTGFFGKSMLDYRLRHPEWPWAKTEWVVLSRSPDRFVSAFPRLANQTGVSFVAGDVGNFRFPDGRFDAVMHMASPIQGVQDDQEAKQMIVSGAKRISEFAHFAGVDNVLFTSSGAVYGKIRGPASENDKPSPITGYGRAKLWVENFLADEGFEVKTARCFALTGPYLARDIHFAIGNFIQNCLDGVPVTINGDGSPVRSYLYSDDLVEWLFAILEHGESGRPYNVGSDESVSLRALAEKVCEVLRSAIPIRIMGQETNTPQSFYVPDVSRAKDELGLRVKTCLRDAIRNSVPQGERQDQ